MPPKEPYFLPLAPGNSVRIRISTEKGDVTSFTVQYETLVDDQWLPVVRYDTAHGQPTSTFSIIADVKSANENSAFSSRSTKRYNGVLRI